MGFSWHMALKKNSIEGLLWKSHKFLVKMSREVFLFIYFYFIYIYIYNENLIILYLKTLKIFYWWKPIFTLTLWKLSFFGFWKLFIEKWCSFPSHLLWDHGSTILTMELIGKSMCMSKEEELCIYITVTSHKLYHQIQIAIQSKHHFQKCHEWPKHQWT